MKNFSIILIIAIILVAIVAGIYYLNKSNNNTTSYETSKLSNDNSLQDTNITNTTEITIPVIAEQEICAFSTKVSGTAARKNNISICSNTINGTTVEPGDTFSFWAVVGDTSAEKGYQKAKSFNEHGETIQTYGGGVCQVSSTIYNAVLLCPELETIERHPHSKKVTYVEENKDAAVAHPSSDYKFKNNTGSKIRIDMNFDNTNLTVRIVKLDV